MITLDKATNAWDIELTKIELEVTATNDPILLEAVDITGTGTWEDAANNLFLAGSAPMLGKFSISVDG